MWGWKTVERVIEPSVPFDEAKRIVQAAGFHLQSSHPSYAVFRRSGTESPWKTVWPDGSKVPIELAVGESEGGLFVQLRYATFVFFDTGDLHHLADEVAAVLGTKESPPEDRPTQAYDQAFG